MNLLGRKDSQGSLSSNSCCDEYECYCSSGHGDAEDDNAGFVVDIDIEDGR